MGGNDKNVSGQAIKAEGAVSTVVSFPYIFVYFILVYAVSLRFTAWPIFSSR